MNPEQQLEVLRLIWGRKARGYVFLPYIPKSLARDAKKRAKGWREHQAFAWPQDRAEVLEHLRAHWDDDLYFAPMVFDSPQRQSRFAATGNRLWADLDEVDPRSIEDQYQPTHAWETSPGRYAAVWNFNEDRPEVTEPGDLNQRLTNYLGADPSGWDTTQLLRVPGSANNKPKYVSELGDVRGQLLWKSKRIGDWDDFDKLPEVEVAVAGISDHLSAEMLSGVDRHEVWGRVRLRVSQRVRQFMRLSDTEGMDRSETAWEIENELADAGCSLLEMVALMQHTVWNKFSGRQDELKRLMIECSRAIEKSKQKKGDDPTRALEEAYEKPKPQKLVPFWQDEHYLNAPEPEWLIEGVIPKGGCGFVAGIPKSMKSWIALDLAISLTTGEKFMGWEIPTPKRVLYIQQEDPETLVRERHHIIASTKDPKYALSTSVDEVQAYPAELYVLVYSGFVGNDEGWQAWLADAIKENDIELVIMDTLATVAADMDMDSGRCCLP